MKPASASRTHRQTIWINYITFIVQHYGMISNQSKQHMHLFQLLPFKWISHEKNQKQIIILTTL